MAIDASIYQNLRPVQTPDIADVMQKAMTLKQLAYQNQQQDYALQKQQALRDAYASNMNPDGTVNQQGAISQYSKIDPMGGIALGNSLSEMAKKRAETTSAEADSIPKQIAAVAPVIQNLNKMSEEDRAKNFDPAMKSLAAQGYHPPNVPMDAKGNYLYDPDHYKLSVDTLMNSPYYQDYLQKQAGVAETKSKTAINYSNVAQGPAALKEKQFGRSSPNATLSNQYAEDPSIKLARSSQGPMQQMLKNFSDKSPQGDASLVLNAFKIKFPNAPDVNSLAELSHAQGVTDQMRQWASQTLNGLKDPETRDNLMRDGIATYEANVGSIRGTQQKYLTKAQNQGVPGAQDIVNEPAVDQTYTAAMKLKKEMGPYVPPTERGGFVGGITKAAANTLGVGSNKANASDQDVPPPLHGFGSIVTIKGTHYKVIDNNGNIEPMQGNK